MSVAQRYKAEDECYQTTVTVKDDDGKGATMHYVLTDDELSASDMEVLDRSLSNSIRIVRIQGIKRAVKKCKEAGYDVIKRT